MANKQGFSNSGRTKKLSRSSDRVLGRAKYRYVVFAIVFASIAALIPHLVDGHVLFLPPAYAESLGILVNVVVASVFYTLYQRDVKSLLLQKDRSEGRLLSSYEYIGKSNRLLQILQKHSVLPAGDLGEKDVKTKMRLMVEEITIEAFAADSALFRFINSENGKTVAEFDYLKDEQSRPLKFSNRRLLAKRTGMAIDGRSAVFVNREYAGVGIICAAEFGRVRSGLDKETSAALVNQIFLLFVYYKLVSLYRKSARINSAELVVEKLIDVD